MNASSHEGPMPIVAHPPHAPVSPSLESLVALVALGKSLGTASLTNPGNHLTGYDLQRPCPAPVENHLPKPGHVSQSSVQTTSRKGSPNRIYGKEGILLHAELGPDPFGKDIGYSLSRNSSY